MQEGTSKKGEVVIKYTLHPLTQMEYHKLPKSERIFTHVHHGVIHLYSDPERYVNHSSSPITYQDLDNGCNIALSDIEIGEAITTDATKDDV